MENGTEPAGAGSDERRQVCSIQQSLDILGQKWVFLIVRNALRGTTKFSDFRTELNVPRDVLSARLAALVEAGILTRETYREHNARSRAEYRLTRRGEELKVVLAALQQWGEQLRPSDTAPATYVQDREGGSVGVQLVGAEGDRLEVDDVHLVAADVAERIRDAAV